MSTSNVSPWYREPWAWFLLAVLTSAVAVGLFLAYVATQGADTLVQDNYYKDGLAINQNLSRDRRAQSLELQAQLSLDSQLGELRVELSGKVATWPEQLQLQLLSPTKASDDITLKLLRTPAGDYLGQLPVALQGRRYVQLETVDRPDSLSELNGRENFPGWRISGQLYFDQRAQYALTSVQD